MEIPPENVFRAQKMMIQTCNKAGKPVIVATQMLESMINNPRPTRAECSDVANAVLDGADCVMLSGETAGGKFPKEAVAIMARTCVEAEQEYNFDEAFTKELAFERSKRVFDTVEATTTGAVLAAISSNAKVVVIFAHTGATATLFAKYKCNVPLVVVTCHPEVARYCKGLVAGASVLFLPNHTRYGYQHESGEDEGVMVTEAVKYAASLGFVKYAEDVVCALHAYRVGTTKNVAMRVFQAGAACA